MKCQVGVVMRVVCMLDRAEVDLCSETRRSTTASVIGMKTNENDFRLKSWNNRILEKRIDSFQNMKLTIAGKV